MSREVCGICWCPYDEDTGECACAPVQPGGAMNKDEIIRMAQEPQGCAHCNHPLYAAVKCRVCGRVTEQAEPVQEPFGYLWPTGRHPEFRFTQQKRDGVDGMPLYTAPPKRKPLSGVAIYGLFVRSGLGAYHQKDFVVQTEYDRCIERFARAVERAHGIGGEE